MTRHILDRKREASAPRAAQYLERDRARTGPHVSTRSLLERGRTEPARLDVFGRLDRQQAREPR